MSRKEEYLLMQDESYELEREEFSSMRDQGYELLTLLS